MQGRADHAQRFAMGAAAMERRELQAAEQIFRGILHDDPGAHPAWNALVIVALQSGAAQAAVEYAQRAVELDRRNALYHSNLGMAYGAAGQLAEAEKAFNRALKLKPVYPEALFNLGKVLHRQGMVPQSLRSYERAHAMGSRSAELCVMLAKMYLRSGQPERGVAVLEHAENPQGEEVITALAACIAQAKGPAVAAELLREALGRTPDSPGLHLMLSHLLLSIGEWREGWQHFAKRYAASAPPALAQRLEAKRIVLLGEQGLGDVLFFLRFAPELANRGARVSLVCAAKIAALLQGDARFAQVVEDRADIEGPADYELAVGDLPATLGAATCPPAFALKSRNSSRERWRERLAATGPAPYLGITWRAGVLHDSFFGGDGQPALSKEVPPQALGETLRGWPGTLISVQRAPDPAELQRIAAAAGAKVHDLSALNDDLAEMTALLDLLDEYVAVSNTNVHLVAGLGRRARVLIPFPPEWRWMRSGSSAWFADFPVYREALAKGWPDALARLRADLFP